VKIDIIAVGRMKSGPERDLCGRYQERFNASAKALSLGPVKVIELAESQARRAEDRKAEEARMILSEIDPVAFVIALDERGAHMTSAAFASQIARQRDEGRKKTQYVIGGADGLDEIVRTRCSLVLSFGAMTMPHQLVRLVLSEQLYRAASIISGHPYHRE
jgi:23S rRNA (pseudouridine1915-N3)-methyltransferase